MGRKLFSRTYTSYPKPHCNYVDDSGGRWIHISNEQYTKVKTSLNKHNKNMFLCESSGTADYLMNGNVVKTNHATSSDIDKGWNFKIYSETKKGLENIARKLGLPLRFN